MTAGLPHVLLLPEAERRVQFARRVAVATQDAPAEGAELRFQIAQVAHVGDPGVGLDLVVVDDHGQFAHCVVHRTGQRFPVLALLELAVARQDVDPTARAGQPVAEDHALGAGDAHAERAGVRVHVRDADVGVARQTAEAAQLVQLLLGECAEPDVGRVEAGYVVSLGGEVDVAVVGEGRVHLVQQQPGDDVGGAEAGSDVARSGAHDAVEGVDTGRVREGLAAVVRIVDAVQDASELFDRQPGERDVHGFSRSTCGETVAHQHT